MLSVQNKILRIFLMIIGLYLILYNYLINFVTFNVILQLIGLISILFISVDLYYPSLIIHN